MTMNILKGFITLFIGPMFAGKTQALIEALKRNQLRGKRTLAVAHNTDDRYGTDSLTTHDGVKMSAMSVATLMENQEVFLEYDVIGIDEGQFFPDLDEFCKKYADMGKEIFVSGIHTDQDRKPFGKMTTVIALCDKVILLQAVCKRCGRDAIFTHRKSTSTALFVVGGEDLYESACRQCFLKMYNEKEEGM